MKNPPHRFEYILPQIVNIKVRPTRTTLAGYKKYYPYYLELVGKSIQQETGKEEPEPEFKMKVALSERELLSLKAEVDKAVAELAL